MGSPLSPIIADIVLQDLEEKALSTLTFIYYRYYRYVDDIAMTAPYYLMDHTLNVFNSLHQFTQFTLEIADNDKLNFLDISILLINNRLLTGSINLLFRVRQAGDYRRESGNTATTYVEIQLLVRVHKDVLPSASCTNVIYMINCADCDASYVGQTSRRLQTRIGEHRNHIRRNTTVGSVITEHRLEFDHDFDWNHVRILDSEKYLNKRLISEMLFIRRQINGLNLQTDTEGLHQTYITSLDKLPNI
ncbi:uncharacterized protein LOC115241033 [Formica exsecta]|uniref:uncharacterized protein LOC115241033 n=1 Tax=Formica exsecta TaxID=72781 RepID=UPI0011427622|nr:uncharacterized protein LOC115241033 [Formica exsecta]